MTMMMMMTRHGFCFELGGFKNGFFKVASANIIGLQCR
jgi:hypothetical protein